MDAQPKEVLRFFEQCEKNEKPVQLAADFGSVVLLLKTRIRREEETLYKEFDALKAAA